MEEELVKLYEAAKKAADAVTSEDGGPAEESRCLDALKQLKDFPVNYRILVKTQVGKHLKHLTEHPRKKIQTFAANLIEIWKKIIVEETQKKNVKPASDNSVGTELVNAGSSKRGVPVKIEKVSRRENAKVDKFNPDVSPRPQKLAKTEARAPRGGFENGNSVRVESPTLAEPIKIERVVRQDEYGSDVKKSTTKALPKLTSMVKCNDAMRDKVRELLFEALSKVSGEADGMIRADVEACDPIRVAVSVESVMFENWG